MDENNATIIFRVNSDLKNAFEATCKRMDTTASQLLRAFVRDMVAQDLQKNGQRSLDLAPTKPTQAPDIEIIGTNTGQPSARKPKKGQKLNTPLRRKTADD